MFACFYKLSFTLKICITNMRGNVERMVKVKRTNLAKLNNDTTE